MTTKAEQTVQWLPVVGWGLDADADGIIAILVARVPPNVSWQVERIVFTTSDGPLPAAGVVFQLYAAEPDPSGAAPVGNTLRDMTTGFTEQVADEASPIRFWSNESIMAVWTGFTPGFDATVYLQVRETQEIIVPEPEIELPEPEPETETPAGRTWA